MASNQDTDVGPVGPNIFRIRRKLRITQKQLAAPEFSISYISAIERGRIRPSLKALEILARRLGVASAELLVNHPDTAEPPAVSEIDSETAQFLSIPELLDHRHPPQLAPLALCWASVFLAQRNYPLASEILDLIAPGTLTPEQHLLLLYFRGVIALEAGRPAEVQRQLEDAFQKEEFGAHAELLVRCRFLLACAYEAQGKFLLASDAFTACAQSIEKGVANEPLFALTVYSYLADLYRRLKRYDVAIFYYRQALSQYDAILNPSTLAEASAQLGRKHLENIHSTLADWYAARSRVLQELVGARQRFAQTATNLGLTLQEQGDSLASEDQLRRAIEIAEQLGTRRQGILTRLDLADMLLERQEALEAERLALAAEEQCHAGEQITAEEEVLYGRVLITLADANKALERLDQAEQYFKQAIDLLKKHQANEYLSQAYFRYSSLLHEKKQDAESYEMVSQAYLLSNTKHDTGGFPRSHA
jgi:tetratricopeptide (TPR) repeat protein/DNA-binding XRE family transcriptional regulator